MPSSFSSALLRWYRTHRRDLPWRRTTDPYAIWVSEVMLQQTRVEAVVPFYERFMAQFPDVRALAAAPEPSLLSAWAGLGYYSRVRNLQRAAISIEAAGQFPSGYDALRALPGIGDYTAAAVASIAFGARHAVLDGNVMRVMARVTNDAGDIRGSATRMRLRDAADARMSRADPGTFNQAVMELGAMLCTPSAPECGRCPVRDFCAGRGAGRERELPVKLGGGARKTEVTQILIIERGSSILMRQRPADSARMAGFWELPDAAMLPRAEPLETLGAFRHAITVTDYRITVQRARIAVVPEGFVCIERAGLAELPVSTTTRKALLILDQADRVHPMEPPG